MDDRSTLLWLEARIKVVEETIRNSTIGREPPHRCVAVLCPKNGDTEICTSLGGVLIILSTVTLATIAFWPHLEDVFFILWEPGADSCDNSQGLVGKAKMPFHLSTYEVGHHGEPLG